jgi:tetratricopeptide (TPR) repeat protein
MRQNVFFRIITARLAGAFFALSLLSTAVVARAAPLDAREREARADFAAGRYQKAVDGFAGLFAETADPVYLRNIARCYQKLKRPQEAIDSFQEYLLKGKNISKAERQEIDGYVKEMEALKASEATAPPVTTPPAAIAPPPATTGAPPATGAGATPAAGAGALPPAPAGAAGPPPALGAVAATPGSAPAPADDGRSWRIAGIATGAAGVVLVAVGIGYGAAAKNAADSVSKQYDASTESDGKRDATLQWVGYGVGVAAIATGAILYIHGMPSGKAPDKGPDKTAGLGLRGGAAFDRNGGALLLQGSF